MPDLRKRNQKIVFVDQPPGKNKGMHGRWMRQLSPLLDYPSRWALIYTCENAEQANKLQYNLHVRNLNIPEPNHNWEFSARGCEVYAIYRGHKRGTLSSVKKSIRR